MWQQWVGVALLLAVGVWLLVVSAWGAWAAFEAWQADTADGLGQAWLDQAADDILYDREADCPRWGEPFTAADIRWAHQGGAVL